VSGSRRSPRLADVRLEGERALLRPVLAADAADAFPLIHGRREVLEWLIWKGPADLAELEKAYASWITPAPEAANYHLAIVDARDGRFAGTLVLRFADHPLECDVGYWVGPPFWGRGLATEAVGLACRLAFRHLRSERAVADVFLGNEASCRVLEKNGFERMPGSSVLELPDGTRRDEWRFRLEREAFERAQHPAPRLEDVCFEPPVDRPLRRRRSRPSS